MRNATDIIFESILIDPNKTNDLRRLLRGCTSSESRMEMIKGYCNRNVGNCLTVEKHVAPRLVAQASWEELTQRIECLFDGQSTSESAAYRSPLFIEKNTTIQ